MTQSIDDVVTKILTSLQTDQSSIQEAIQAVRTAISTGDITNATGVAIGNSIVQFVQHFDLPSGSGDILHDLRVSLGAILGAGTNQYSWENLVKDKLENFVGREYIFNAINQFIAGNPSGYFIIEGDPGMGKSALLAEYVRRTGCLAHFNIRGMNISSSTQFLKNICTQIIVDARLPYTYLRPETTEDGAFLLKLLREATASQPSKKTV